MVAVPSRSEPSRRKAPLEAARPEDELVVVPDAAVARRPEEPGRSAEPSRPATPRPRTVATSDGPYKLPPIDLLRTAPPSTHDGARRGHTVMEALERTFRTFGVDAQRVGRAPRPHRDDVRGRGRGRARRSTRC